MIPEAWQNDHLMSASKKAYYRWNAYSMEPWDGPGLCLSVCLSVCHGHNAGLCLRTEYVLKSFSKLYYLHLF